MRDEKKLGQFLTLIEKQVGYAITSSDYLEYKDDIVNEAFIKLYKSGAFDKYTLDTGENGRIAAAYVKKTVHSCTMDYFRKSGVYRRLTKHEQATTGLKTQSIETSDFDEHSADENTYHDDKNTYTVEQYLTAKKAYENIQKCFTSLVSNITNTVRANFLKEAFWVADNYGVPLKQLAEILGYEKSNPTQDFNRFVEKVSDCTKKYNIKIVNSGEQIEFLRQIISSSGGETA
jgi:DNA-directed RNA polymerase specialized sigma24 family protein